MRSTYSKCLISIHLGACGPHRGGDGLLAGAASAPRHIVPSSAHRAPYARPPNYNSHCQYLNYISVPHRFHRRQPNRWLGRQEVGIAVLRCYGCVTSSQLNPPAFSDFIEDGRSRNAKIPIAPVTFPPGEGASDSCHRALSSVGVSREEYLFLSYTAMYP